MPASETRQNSEFLKKFCSSFSEGFVSIKDEELSSWLVDMVDLLALQTSREWSFKQRDRIERRGDVIRRVCQTMLARRATRVAKRRFPDRQRESIQAALRQTRNNVMYRNCVLRL